MNRNRRAFTLIELLVVIAIIAILAAILFPVFAQAKMAAKKTVALSNAKQVALASFIYMNDYDDNLIKEYFGFPPPPCSAWGNTYYDWRYAMQPYLAKSQGLLADPTNPFNQQVDFQPGYSVGNVNSQFLPENFAVDNNIIGFANGPCAGVWTPPGLSTLDSVPQPADTMIIMPNRSQWNDLKIDFMSIADEAPPAWCVTLWNQQTGLTENTQVCPATGNGPIHAIGAAATFIWGDGHAKFKNVLSTAMPNNPTWDEWDSAQATSPQTGQPWTQAQRQQIVQTGYPEYLNPNVQ
jgi:prepilin-type N-terminal cleavage/methylation domain-containing protein